MTKFIDEPDTIRNEVVDKGLLIIDNRTTELREKLTERGVDWLDESNGYADVTTFIANGVKWTVISKSYLNPDHDWMKLRAERITPEQAIAATLGKPEIVRCRDCKHATISTTGVCKYCEMFVLPDTDGYGADPQVNLPLEFFCGFAEHKEMDE